MAESRARRERATWGAPAPASACAAHAAPRATAGAGAEYRTHGMRFLPPLHRRRPPVSHVSSTPPRVA